jgi:septal ring factor EnvC (AmiA/AmiB activator)
MRRYVVFAVSALFFAATAAQADFYRWTDKDGKEYFTNEKESVPPEYRDSAQRVKPDESRVSVGDKPAASAKTGGLEHRDKFGRGEEYWRKQSANLRLKLRDQQDEYSQVIKELDDQDKKPKKLTSKKKTSASSLEKNKLKLEKEIARTRRRLEVDLPEEARRADAYPGWLRE